MVLVAQPLPDLNYIGSRRRPTSRDVGLTTLSLGYVKCNQMWHNNTTLQTREKGKLGGKLYRLEKEADFL